MDELASERDDLTDERAADWEAFVDDLDQLHLNPLDLNRASASQLSDLFFLSPAHVQAIIGYRERHGSFRTMSELLFLPEMDWRTRQLLHLFAFVGPPEAQTQVARRNSLRHSIVARADVPLYQRDGWPWGRGVANRWQWDMTLGPHYEAGLHAKTDAGERMFCADVKGWDAMGGYVHLADRGWLRHAIVGDYRLHIGEGLVASNSFRFGKTGIGQWHSANSLRPQRSASEYSFMRGAVAALQAGRHWTLTAFYSWRKLDATIQADNSVRTIAQTGLHRSAHEQAQRHTLGSHTAGADASWQHGPWQAGIAGLFQHYNRQLSRGPALYQQIAPEGNRFGAASVHYGYRRYPLEAHGETARCFGTDNNAWASVNHLSWHFNANTWCTLSQRFFGKYYFSPYANCFSESGKAQNESGVCLSVEAERVGPFALSAFADLFYSPWPRYTMSRESRGGEGMLQLTFRQNRRNSIGLRYRVKSKERSDRRYWSHRLQATTEHRLTAQWQLRMAAHWHLYAQPAAEGRPHRHSTGVAAGPQALFGSRNGRWRWQTQAFWFRTDDYYSRIFASEPHVPGGFHMPNFSGSGVRAASLIRYTLSRRLNLQAHMGCTRYLDRDEISSGLTRIRSAWKTDLSLMARITL